MKFSGLMFIYPFSPCTGTQEPNKWALCRIVITWYKSAILGRKLRTGTSKTKLVNLNFLCFRCPSGQFASHYGGFVPCDHYPAKGPLTPSCVAEHCTGIAEVMGLNRVEAASHHITHHEERKCLYIRAKWAISELLFVSVSK